MRKVAGFTLLELAVVLVIVSVVTAMGLVATFGALESARRTATENKLNEIEKALAGFRAVNERLPCPAEITLASSDAEFGLESLPIGECLTGSPNATAITADDTVVMGAVPVKALGLPDEFMYDGWGRRFFYRVMAAYTSERSFQFMRPQEQCGSKVLASSNTANTRSTNAIYSLISTGPNGHGGYLAGGTRMNAGSTNTAEQYNCWCSVAAADSADASAASTLYAVQQDFTEDSTTATNTYDDIVRFKERWQMMDENDARDFNANVDVQMVIGFTFSGASGAASVFKRQCDTFVNTQTAGTSSADNSVPFVGITNNNAHLVIYDSGGTNCELFNISGSTISAGTAFPTTLITCATYNANNAVALSNNGYLAITHTSSPYLQLWRLSGTKFIGVNSSFAAAPASQPDKVALSKNAEHVALSKTDTYTTIYRRDVNNVLREITALAGMPAGSPAIAFSSYEYPNIPNPTKAKGILFAAADVAPTADIKIWQYKDNKTYAAFTPAITLNTSLASSVSAISFSPDGHYMAAVAQGTGTLSDIIAVYKIDFNADGANFTPVTVTGTFTSTAAMQAVEWTPDSAYVVAIEASSTNSRPQKVVMLKRQSATSFTYKIGVDTLPSGSTPRSLAIYH